MGVYLKDFDTHAEYLSYRNGENYIRPNVSYCENNNEVHYNWYDTRLIAKFNVTDTSNATDIMYSGATSQFSNIEIDGVLQQNVVSSYTFSTTGEHTVKYTLADPTYIGGYGFQVCSNLISAEIPSSVTNIGDYVFFGCTNLTNITMPSSLTSIGNAAFRNCSGLTSIVIPTSVTSIGTYVFYNCTGLTNIDIPTSLTSISQNAFGGCTNLESVTIPSSVTTIEQNAFTGCGLTSVTIPSSVTTIGDHAFQQCGSLSVITCYATTAPSISNKTFFLIKSGGTLYVPNGSTGYNIWIQNADYYLGKYGWTKVEQ